VGDDSTILAGENKEEIIAGTAAGGAKVLWVYLGGSWLTSSLGI
jgi:hypothetical protein